MTLPNFLIIGAMKAGTTSLFRWLGLHPECSLPRVKEPRFFSDEEKWERGLAWYSSLFAQTEGRVTGEASPSYTRAETSHLAAERIYRALPDVKCIFLVRDPEERLRSQYRHTVQRHLEKRRFHDAISDGNNVYVPRSLYWKCIEPYANLLPPSQLRVVHFEDLFSPPHRGWRQVLRYLDLSPMDVPHSTHNVSAAKRGFSGPLHFLWRKGWLRNVNLMPSAVRRAGRNIMMRDDREYKLLLKSSREDPLPAHVLDVLTEDWKQFKEWSS